MQSNIEAERGRLRLTKAEVAKMLDITQKTYMSYVNGNTPIPSDVLLKMKDLFSCSADYLLSSDFRNQNESA